MDTCTGWTNVNLLYFPDSIEIASLEGLALSQDGHWHGDAPFSWLEDNDLPLNCGGCIFLTCHYRDNPSSFTQCVVRTLKADQPLTLILNLLFYHFNRSEPTYTSQHIKFLDIIAECNQLNVNALN